MTVYVVTESEADEDGGYHTCVVAVFKIKEAADAYAKKETASSRWQSYDVIEMSVRED